MWSAGFGGGVASRAQARRLGTRGLVEDRSPYSELSRVHAVFWGAATLPPWSKTRPADALLSGEGLPHLPNDGGDRAVAGPFFSLTYTLCLGEGILLRLVRLVRTETYRFAQHAVCRL